MNLPLFLSIFFFLSLSPLFTPLSLPLPLFHSRTVFFCLERRKKWKLICGNTFLFRGLSFSKKFLRTFASLWLRLMQFPCYPWMIQTCKHSVEPTFFHATLVTPLFGVKVLYINGRSRLAVMTWASLSAFFFFLSLYVRINGLSIEFDIF